MASGSDVAALREAYRRLAIRSGEAMEQGESRRANKAQAELLAVRHAIRAAGPDAIHMLTALLDDESAFVRLCAGIDALELAPADGERVLEELARAPRGVASLNAEMSLTLWRKGEFTVRWWRK